MSSPFDGFQNGLMTGAQLGRGAYQAGQRRAVGGLMASGDYAGARDAAYGQGDISTGAAIDGRVQQQAAQARNVEMGGMIQSGDYEGAQGVAAGAGDLQGMAQVQAWASRASEQEKEATAEALGRLASVAQSLQSLPPEQRFARAQELAPQFGIDPAQITPESLSDEGIQGLVAQAIGLKDFLSYQQRERDATRPIMTPYGIMLPPGAPAPNMGPQSFDTLPQGWTPTPRPDQPARGQPERAQQSSVSFGSTDEARRAIAQIVPGVTFTSGERSAAENRRVGGVPTSNHLRARAWDLVPPQGMSMAQLHQTMRAQGFRALNEGDHIHVSW